MIVTTSRYVSRQVRDEAIKIAKEKKAVYTARGKKTIEQLVHFAWKNGHSSILLVRERDGKVFAIDEIAIDHWGKWKWK